MSGDGTPEPDLLLVRRLDWRFLLPDPRLDRVAYLGPAGGMLPQALDRFAGTCVPARRGADRTAAFDVVVVASGRSGDVRDGCSLLRPGGHLYWEVDRSAAPLPVGGVADGWRGGPAGYLRDPGCFVASLGLRDVRVHWHHPGHDDARMIFPTHPSAIRYALGRRSAHGGLAGRLIAAAAPRSVLPRLLPHPSVLARKPGGENAPVGTAPAVKRGAEPGTPDDGTAGGSYVLLTPRFRASRHVVTVYPDARTGNAARVAKTARLPGRSPSLEREARALSAVADILLERSGSVPRLLSLAERGGHRTLVESAVDGRVLTPDRVRSDPAGTTERVVEWITELHRATRIATDGAHLRERLIERPLVRLEDHIPLGPTEHRLLDRTRTLTRPLANMRLPSVLEHGDVSCPNILVSKAGSVGLVDWERGDPAGLPAADLFFFLAFAALSRATATEGSNGDADGANDAVHAFRRAFRDPAAGARPWIRRYWRALDLPEEALAPLFVGTWSRYVCGLLDRVGPGEVAAAEWLRANRYFRFWSEACGWAEDLTLE